MSAWRATAVPTLPTTIPRGDVGEAGGLEERDLDGHGGGEGGDDGVAGAGDVEHVFRFGGVVADVVIGDEAHAVFGAGDEDGAEPVALQQHLGGGDDAGFGVDGQAGGFGELAAVGGDDVGAGVAGVIPAFRVDDDGAAERLGGGDQAGGDVGAEDAFAVVREDGHRVVAAIASVAMRIRRSASFSGSVMVSSRSARMRCWPCAM